MTTVGKLLGYAKTGFEVRTTEDGYLFIVDGTPYVITDKVVLLQQLYRMNTSALGKFSNNVKVQSKEVAAKVWEVCSLEQKTAFTTWVEAQKVQINYVVSFSGFAVTQKETVIVEEPVVKEPVVTVEEVIEKTVKKHTQASKGERVSSNEKVDASFDEIVTAFGTNTKVSKEIARLISSFTEKESRYLVLKLAKDVFKMTQASPELCKTIANQLQTILPDEVEDSMVEETEPTIEEATDKLVEELGDGQVSEEGMTTLGILMEEMGMDACVYLATKVFNTKTENVNEFELDFIKTVLKKSATKIKKEMKLAA
jgi:hypothetical protein